MYSLQRVRSQVRPSQPKPKIKGKELKLIQKLVEVDEVITPERIQQELKCNESKAEIVLKEVKRRKQEIVSVIRSQPGNESFTPKGFQDHKANGVIYLVEHELYDGWVKCGMTTDMISRLKGYNSSDPLKRFQVITSKEVSDRRRAEKILLNDMEMKASMRNGEWFKVEKDIALLVFNSIEN